MQDDFAQRVIECVAKTQHIEASRITVASTFEELNIDSLDGINILFALESEFNVNIPDDSAKGLKSIGDLVEGMKKLAAPPAV